MGAVSYSYNDYSNKEDLLGIITDISPKETQLISGLGTSVAAGIYHQWLYDALSAVKSNAYIEGVDASYAVTDPTRGLNVTQIVRQGYDVSDTQESTDHAGFGDRFAYEASKAMKIWKNDAELALLQGSLACGSTSTARTMQGIANFIVATNVTNQSGTSLNEQTLVDYLQRVWNYGGEVDEVYVGAALKNRINGFTAGATKNVALDDKRLVNAVDVYESSFAPLVKIFLHRYANTDTTHVANATNMIIGIDSDMYKVAYLRKPKMRDLAKTGDSTRGEVVGELTLEDRSGGKAGFVGQQHR